MLGVRRDAPAAEGLLVIEPHLADLTFARGAVVTELGVVDVSWSVGGGALSFNITLPGNVRQAALRLAGADPATLVLGGAPAAAVSVGRYAVAVQPLAAGTVSGSVTLLSGGAQAL